jgi:NIMA (never in mitosis gene a)-related kinase
MMKLSPKEKENALNEVRILASISNPNICAYKEAFFEEAPNSLCIVMEYCDNGDLQSKIDSAKKAQKFTNEETIWSIFYQMVLGLKALHDLKIIHRDIKCANVFLTKAGQVKLGDLNVSKIAKAGILQTQTGTPYYASPEVWQDKPYNNKSDIWSLGCVLYELIALNPPFTAKDMKGLYNRVMKGVYPKIPSRYSSDLSTILSSLLQIDPEKRPSCD